MSILPDDPRERRATIESLLSALSPWELLDLRRQFKEGLIPIRNLAGLEHLPVEIVSSIGLSLHVDDLIKCRQVCKDWHRTWTHPAVARLLIRYRFPGLLEMHAESQDLAALFLRACKTYLRRHLLPMPIVFVKWNERHLEGGQRVSLSMGAPSLEPFDRPEFAIFCNNGLLAWQASGLDDVFIDDLRGLNHHCIKFGRSLLSGYHLQLKAVSENLLVLLRVRSENANRVLHVYHLQRGETKEITLPALFETCYIQKETIAVVTRAGAVLVWTWDGKLIELTEGPGAAEAGVKGRAQVLPGVLFHPTRLNVIFTVRLFSLPQLSSREPESQSTLVVLKYEDFRPTKHFARILPAFKVDPFGKRPFNNGRTEASILEPLDNLFEASSVTTGRACRKMNAYGLHVLALYDAGPHRLVFGSSITDLKAADEVVWVAECFDVQSDSFHRYVYEPVEKYLPKGSFQRQSGQFCISSASFLDDELLIQYSEGDKLITEGYQNFHCFRACQLDNQIMAPGVDSYRLRQDRALSISRGKSQGALMLVDEEVNVVATRGAYEQWRSEAAIW